MNHVAHLTDGIAGPASGYVTGKTTTANAQVVAAGETGQYFYLTDLIMINHDTTTVITVTLKSGTTTILPLTLDAGQGVSHAFSKPLKFTNAATAVNVGLSAIAGSPGVDVVVNGFYSTEAR